MMSASLSDIFLLSKVDDSSGVMMFTRRTGVEGGRNTSSSIATSSPELESDVLSSSVVLKELSSLFAISRLFFSL